MHYPDRETPARRFSKFERQCLQLVSTMMSSPRSGGRTVVVYFINRPAKHLRICPRDTGEAVVGHFGFFNRRFA